MLEAVGAGASAEEIAASTGKPLFSVRSSMRQLGEAGLVVETDGRFSRTAEGAAKAAEPD
jgi:DNA-binding IclR family transcriptional regulator